jgi:hypothetical protein
VRKGRAEEGREEGNKKRWPADPLLTVYSGPCGVWPSNSGCHATGGPLAAPGPPARSRGSAVGPPLLDPPLLAIISFPILTSSLARWTWDAARHLVSHTCETAVAGIPTMCRGDACTCTTPPAPGAMGRDAAVLDPLPAAVEGSHLHALHFVEGLHWPRLESGRCPMVPQEATTTFQVNLHSCENSSSRVWLGSRVQRFSTDSFSCGGMRCLHEPAACVHQCLGSGHRLRRP